MEYGQVTCMRSNNLNETIAVYNSKVKEGHVYKFFRTKGDEYRYCRCKELGKYRAIRIINDTVVGRKSPEEGHHPDCEPLPKAAVLAAEVDRDMRHEVRTHGKRPRDAFNNMMSALVYRLTHL